jgi:hypothetical protein
MANASKRKYQHNYCVGLRIEIPNKLLVGKDLVKFYKKQPGVCLMDLCKGGKVIARRVGDLILAKNDGEGGSVSSFSLMINMNEDLEGVKRLARILNILGDDKLFKERVNTFVTGKSVLSALPEFVVLKQALISLDQLIPRFTDLTWFSGPDAKLR